MTFPTPCQLRGDHPAKGAGPEGPADSPTRFQGPCWHTPSCPCPCLQLRRSLPEEGTPEPCPLPSDLPGQAFPSPVAYSPSQALHDFSNLTSKASNGHNV